MSKRDEAIDGIIAHLDSFDNAGYRDLAMVPPEPRRPGKPLAGGWLELPPEKPHLCKPPGFWARLCNGVRTGQVWHCGRCEMRWRYSEAHGDWRDNS